jgi:hypothetical protein
LLLCSAYSYFFKEKLLLLWAGCTELHWSSRTNSSRNSVQGSQLRWSHEQLVTCSFCTRAISAG